jgi:lipopolysaccharide/colanic/teichoic acid biosynthesis glycosyltransferase
MKTGAAYANSPEKWMLDRAFAASLALPALGSRLLLGHLLRDQEKEDADPIFRQQRTGVNGLPFTVHKLRTLNSQTGKPFNRITAVMRRYGLDELVQASNIWQGQMGAVGYRPLPLAELAEMYDIAPSKLVDEHRRVVLPTLPGALSNFALLKHLEPHKYSTPEQKAVPMFESDIRDVREGSLARDIALIGQVMDAVVWRKMGVPGDDEAAQLMSRPHEMLGS